MFDNTVIYTCIFFLIVLSGVVLLYSKRIKYFKKLSETDQMTSLMNYRGLCMNIEELLKQKLSFSLAIIDIDNFRIFNKHSYKLGDDVLKEFALLLNKTFPENTIIARFRIGDEFVIVFQNINIEQAKIKIEDFKDKCGKHIFNSIKGFSTNRLYFTEGLVETGTIINSIETLFSEAENALKINKSKNINANN
jgi:diguanylate cyclase (GGDEF)-like protein